MERLKRVIGAIGAITRLYSLAFLLPAFIALAYDPWDFRFADMILPKGFVVFMFCFTLTFLVGSALRTVRSAKNIQDRDAYLTVGLGWLVLCAFSALPFMLHGLFSNPVDAFFEAMSGMTTMGATVIAGALEDVAPSLHIWRALMQFIGGMGIVVLAVAVLARLTQGGAQMLQAEAPGPTMTRMAPRLAQTARILWSVYLAVAAACFLLMSLILTRHDMDGKTIVYEALLHTFTTVATGGFSNHTESIAYFNDPLFEAVIILFVLISGTNYTLHYYLLTRRRTNMLHDPEWRFFIGMYLAATAIITLFLWRAGGGIESLRAAAFTAASLITSTGYVTADYDAWPAVTKMILFLLMFTGATAGSTSGGIKHVRIMLFFGLIKRQFVRILHPRAVVPLKLGQRPVQETTLTAVAAFFIAYLTVWGIGAVLLSFDPLITKPFDAAGTSVSAVSNMGPAFGVTGPTMNYAGLTNFSKLVITFQMWFGRLEIFAALMVFMPRAWKH